MTPDRPRLWKTGRCVVTDQAEIADMLRLFDRSSASRERAAPRMQRPSVARLCSAVQARQTL